MANSETQLQLIKFKHTEPEVKFCVFKQDKTTGFGIMILELNYAVNVFMRVQPIERCENAMINLIRTFCFFSCTCCQEKVLQCTTVRKFETDQCNRGTNSLKQVSMIYADMQSTILKSFGIYRMQLRKVICPFEQHSDKVHRKFS